MRCALVSLAMCSMPAWCIDIWHHSAEDRGETTSTVFVDLDLLYDEWKSWEN